MILKHGLNLKTRNKFIFFGSIYFPQNNFVWVTRLDHAWPRMIVVNHVYEGNKNSANEFPSLMGYHTLFTF